MKEKNLGFWEKLPRNRPVGGLLGAVALLAFIPNVRPLFPPEGNLIWLIPSALILALLCYLYLDYLFARAAAGGLILLVHWLLNEVFSADLRGGSFFSLLSLAAGTYAIFIAAKPYWLRDSFRAICRKWKWRLTGSVFAFLWALSASILLVQLARRLFR
ncbi:MAG: hypothetical protein J5806_05780 [Lentisphaeria bacterium]|nr:hypothetical protein [Lentisphaeria bacterium]